MDNRYRSREAQRSRSAYTAQCAFEYFVTILVSDAFLAKLLKHIGLDDAAAGIIALGACVLIERDEKKRKAAAEDMRTGGK